MQLCRTKFRKSCIFFVKNWIKCFPGIRSNRGENLDRSRTAPPRAPPLRRLWTGAAARCRPCRAHRRRRRICASSSPCVPGEWWHGAGCRRGGRRQVAGAERRRVVQCFGRSGRRPPRAPCCVVWRKEPYDAAAWNARPG